MDFDDFGGTEGGDFFSLGIFNLVSGRSDLLARIWRDDDKASTKATELHNPKVDDRRRLPLDDNHDKATNLIANITTTVSE